MLAAMAAIEPPKPTRSAGCCASAAGGRPALGGGRLRPREPSGGGAAAVLGLAGQPRRRRGRRGQGRPPGGPAPLGRRWDVADRTSPRRPRGGHPRAARANPRARAGAGRGRPRRRRLRRARPAPRPPPPAARPTSRPTSAAWSRSRSRGPSAHPRRRRARHRWCPPTAASTSPGGWLRRPGRPGPGCGGGRSRLPPGRRRTTACFIHRDYHPANTLWADGRLVGVVGLDRRVVGAALGRPRPHEITSPGTSGWRPPTGSWPPTGP